MGNCLNCVGGGQQDNANLLNNGSDTAIGIGVSQDNLRPSLSYNVIYVLLYFHMCEPGGNRYSSTSLRGLSQSTEVEISQSIGIGVGLSTGGGPIINEEEQQIRMAKRIGLIQHLPTRQFDGTKKGECVICMMELVIGEDVRYLPCMHTYHAICIDDWLLRSLTCPTCMEPVDAALINSYHPTT